MKKIVIILAFIFVGMASAMQQRSLLDGNDMRKYVHTDPEEIAYLKGIEDLYKRIQQRKSHTQQAVQSEGPTGGPDLEQIFSFLKPVQNHNVSHAKPLIFGFLQEVSVGNVEEHREEFNEESNPKKRTLEEAASSDERNKDFPEESIVSKVSKKVARKSLTVSKNMEICGINGCSVSTALSNAMKRHKETLHEQKPCPYPGCAFHHQSKGELREHIKRSHPEKFCPVCGYTPKERGNLLKHLQHAKHRPASKNPASINLGKGKIA